MRLGNHCYITAVKMNKYYVLRVFLHFMNDHPICAIKHILLAFCLSEFRPTKDALAHYFRWMKDQENMHKCGGCFMDFLANSKYCLLSANYGNDIAHYIQKCPLIIQKREQKSNKTISDPKCSDFLAKCYQAQ
jgi:hypothetical protein